MPDRAEKQLDATIAAAAFQKQWFADLRRRVFDELRERLAVATGGGVPRAELQQLDGELALELAAQVLGSQRPRWS